MATVSVIIPNFNRASIIGETIHNMLSQSLPPYEVIVVDDGSTDHSTQVIRQFGSRIILLQQSNKGPGAARNAGLNIASGEFIQFMDSDDLASVNKLQVQVEALTNNKADIIYGPWVKIWKTNNAIRLENAVLQQAPLPASHSVLCWFLTNWSMVFQQCLVRRSLLQQVGGYPENMRSYEDGILFIKLLMAGGKIIYEPDSLTFYRLDDYGKLTASGQQQFKRTLDEACFYAQVMAMSDHHDELQHCTHHRLFRLKLWRVLRELSYYKEVNADQFKRLHALAGKNPVSKRFQCWLNTKLAGMQQLLRGHRWPGCYQAGSLNDHQQQLISQLGWQLIK